MDNIRQRFPDLKVTIISSYHDEELIKDYMNRGARAFVSKREGVDVAIQAIQHVYATGFYRANLERLYKNPAPKDRHYFQMLFKQREKEIIVLLCEAKTNPEIAAELCISEKTVQGHFTKMFKKAKVENRNQLLKYALDAGLQFLHKSYQHKIKPLH